MAAKKKVSRRKFLTGATAFGAATLAAGKVAAQVAVPAHDPQVVFLPTVLQGGGEGAPMNVITITCDTLRYDHIGTHGNGDMLTPNIDAFAAQSQVFHRAYAGGFPTVHNRSELFTGRFLYPFMSWEDLPEEETTMAQVLSQAGFTTGLIFDTYHLKDGGFSLDRGFGSWEWVRGQEKDRHRAVPKDPPLPADAAKLRDHGLGLKQHLRNTAGRSGEADYSVARTMQAAVEWLKHNHAYGPFYLHVDSFDPHEPWDPPQQYVDLYSPGYVGQVVGYPAYAPAGFLSAAEMAHMRALYQAEITFADQWLGVFLKEIDALGLAERTVVMFMSDHGFLLGEHGAIGKEWSHDGHYEAYPLYQELVHIPMMIRFPGQAGRDLEALVQPADIMPTVLEIMGATTMSVMHGVSLVPYLMGEPGSPREYAASSNSLKLSLDTKPRPLITDGQWTLLDGSGQGRSELYFLPDDPGQDNDLLATHCVEAHRLHQALLDLWGGIGVPTQILDQWLPQPC
jgi:arylsulfatase A-like enzyme